MQNIFEQTARSYQQIAFKSKLVLLLILKIILISSCFAINTPIGFEKRQGDSLSKNRFLLFSSNFVFRPYF